MEMIFEGEMFRVDTFPKKGGRVKVDTTSHDAVALRSGSEQRKKRAQASVLQESRPP